MRKLFPVFAFLFSAVAANATVIFNLTDPFSGADPGCSGPCLTATFVNVPGGVELNLSGPGLVGSEFISSFGFNLDPSFDIASLSVSQLSGPAASWSAGANCCKMDGGGYYDVRLSFPTAPPSSRFLSGSVATFLLTGAPGLSEESFKYLATGSSIGTDYAAAHLQAISGGSSAWIGGRIEDPPSSVPEPATASSLLVAAALLIPAVRRRRKQ